MSLSNYKITANDISIYGVASAPDKLTGTAAENKAVFDKLIRECFAGLYNNLIDTLEGLGVENTVLLPTAAGMKYIRLNSDGVLETSEDGEDWEATGSSGHIIVDKDGNTLPQRSRLKFSNGTVQDVDGVTVVTGVKGDKGDTGDTGPQGPTGATGAQGPQGYVLVPAIDSDGVISWSIQTPSGTVPASRNIRGPQGIQGIQGPQGETGATGATGATGPTGPQGPKGDTGATGAQGPQGIQGIQGVQGPKGDDGADGTDFTVLGMYATLNDLMAAHPTGSAGDAYAVGTASSNVVYLWDVDHELWQNVGPLRGPQGAQGPQGIQGIQGPAGADGATGATGPQGPQGETGATGATGAQGPQGEQGPQGQQGVQGPQGEQGAAGPNTVTNSTTTDLTGVLCGDGGAVSAKPLAGANGVAAQNEIAPVEVSPSGHPYSVGDFLTYNGDFYRVTAAIAVNDALATTGAGANITASNVAEALAAKADKTELPAPSSTTPQRDGTGAAGSSAAYARADHVHPTGVLTPSAAFAIPASGSSVSYDLTGLTADHELVRWNFADSGTPIAENAPPVDLTWTTAAGYFTITNNGGTTTATMRPVFALPAAIAISAHS